MAKDKPPIVVKHGHGVMSKDGGTPFAAGTILATQADGMSYGCVYSPTAVAVLLADDTVREIKIIDLDNVQSVITKTWVEKVACALTQKLTAYKTAA